MYGHVPEYLDAQALRLRAERAETLAKTWRMTGLAFGMALAFLLFVVVMQERQLAVSNIDVETQQLFEDQEREIYVALQRAVDAEEAADAATKRFAICKSANSGLVEVLHELDQTVKDQQQLIRDSVELAKRCESSPVTWAATAPEGWQVVGHAR